MPKALIFVPLSDPQAQHWVRTCWAYCLRNGYTPHAIVHDWASVLALLLGGLTAVVVVGRREHLPPERIPRVEVITEEKAESHRPEQRRPSRKSEDPQ